MAKVSKVERAVRSAEGSLGACQREAARAEKALAAATEKEKMLVGALEALDDQMKDATADREEALRVVANQRFELEAPLAAAEATFKDMEEKFTVAMAEGRKQVAEARDTAEERIAEVEGIIQAQAEKLEPLLAEARQVGQSIDGPLLEVREAVKGCAAAVNLAKDAVQSLQNILEEAREAALPVRVYSDVKAEYVPPPPSPADGLKAEEEKLAQEITDALGLGTGAQ